MEQVRAPPLSRTSRGFYISRIPVGERINDYIITRKIGQGGMAHVYEAWKDDGLIALKIFPQSYGIWGGGDQFETEVQLHSRVDHPNVVSLYDVGTFEDRPYMVMERIEGESLADRIKHSKLHPRLSLSLMIDLASALEAVHEKNIVHRDIKPSNVMIDESLNAILIDFGIGVDPRVMDTSKESDLTGSLGYFSPEQLANKPVGYHTDQWQLGVTFYACLLGREIRRTPDEMINWKPECLPSSLRLDVPYSWDEPFFRMVADNPVMRFPNMQAAEKTWRDLLTQWDRRVTARKDLDVIFRRAAALKGDEVYANAG